MGQDKGLSLFLGQRLVERVVERVVPVADEVLVTTNRPEGYRFLDVPLVPDVIPGYGALGGLYTALMVASHPLVAVVACDMPFANLHLLGAERDAAIETQADVVIPQTEMGLEPFHAVYRRDTCLPQVKASLDEGKRRVDAWFPRVKVRFLIAEEILAHDPHQLAFVNVNTPEELERIENLARELGECDRANPKL
jgi:molybdopterin-guanine dinucleotide biosynthesis protein A